jgi:hypothetical protein
MQHINSFPAYNITVERHYKNAWIILTRQAFQKVAEQLYNKKSFNITIRSLPKKLRKKTVTKAEQTFLSRVNGHTYLNFFCWKL